MPLLPSPLFPAREIPPLISIYIEQSKYGLWARKGVCARVVWMCCSREAVSSPFQPSWPANSPPSCRRSLGTTLVTLDHSGLVGPSFRHHRTSPAFCRQRKSCFERVFRIMTRPGSFASPQAPCSRSPSVGSIMAKKFGRDHMDHTPFPRHCAARSVPNAW